MAAPRAGFRAGCWSANPVGRRRSVGVPRGAAHRAANPGEEVAVFIEVQTGAYFGEDDIERLQDDHGRDSGV
ncbi:hypothetical protein [Streptosporangium canum]|uniref:hypothetical protein n=1 Tax=Streptosporangium canum TaxID=324952 RepID=UPI0037938280